MGKQNESPADKEEMSLFFRDRGIFFAVGIVVGLIGMGIRGAAFPILH